MNRHQPMKTVTQRYTVTELGDSDAQRWGWHAVRLRAVDLAEGLDAQISFYAASEDAPHLGDQIEITIAPVVDDEGSGE